MLLVRLIGIDGYGVYNFVYAIVILLCIPAEFGLPNLLIRETAKGFENDKFGHVKDILRWSSKITGLTTSVLIMISIIILFLYRNQNLSEIEFYSFLVGLGLVPIIAYLQILKGALQGIK